MMKGILVRNKLINWLFKTGKYRTLFRKVAKPSSKVWAQYLRLHGGFHQIGDETEINVGAVITDPYLVSIGNNCTLSDCYLIAHDASIRQIENFCGAKVDAVGSIIIEDNRFIGINATILRNVRIGKNSIIAAGSVVVSDIPPNSVAAGVPAKVISDMGSYSNKLSIETQSLPWADIIEKRKGAFDSKVEDLLCSKRSQYFWGER